MSEAPRKIQSARVKKLPAATSGDKIGISNSAQSEDTCEYYERGLVAPGIDCNTPPPYLEEIGDPLDAEGYVHLPQEPGMGYKINWDYIEDNTI